MIAKVETKQKKIFTQEIHRIIFMKIQNKNTLQIDKEIISTWNKKNQSNTDILLDTNSKITTDLLTDKVPNHLISLKPKKIFTFL